MRDLIVLVSLLLGTTGTLCASFPALAAEGTGQLAVRVTDHREAIGDFKRLEIAIASIRIKQNPRLEFFRSGWTHLTPQLNQLDLTQYTGSRSALIFDSNVPPGKFEGFELKLSRVQGVLKGGQPALRLKYALYPVALRFYGIPRCHDHHHARPDDS